MVSTKVSHRAELKETIRYITTNVIIKDQSSEILCGSKMYFETFLILVLSSFSFASAEDTILQRDKRFLIYNNGGLVKVVQKIINGKYLWSN